MPPTDSSSQSWDAHADRWQQLLNARPIPPRELHDPSRPVVPVLVRCLWSVDGAQWVPGAAQDWVGRDVHVRIDDDRIGAVRWAWVDADDVRRTPESG